LSFHDAKGGHILADNSFRCFDYFGDDFDVILDKLNNIHATEPVAGEDYDHIVESDSEMMHIFVYGIGNI
jgi:hypothetical protein